MHLQCNCLWLRLFQFSFQFLFEFVRLLVVLRLVQILQPLHQQPTHFRLTVHSEKVGVLAAYSQTAWVIMKIGSKVWQHVIAFRYQVVVAPLKKQPMASVIFLEAIL